MDGRSSENPRCCFHPTELVVGVCALCLRERLLILAADQESVFLCRDRYYRRSLKDLSTTSGVIPKVFSLASFLHRRRFRSSSDEVDSIPTLDDSFISIKFEDDGQASWDRKTNVATQSRSSWSGARPQLHDQTVVVVDRRGGGLRWRKRVGHIFFQVLRWKRSSKQSSSHAPADVAGKGRRGWIRRLTMRNASAVEL